MLRTFFGRTTTAAAVLLAAMLSGPAVPAQVSVPITVTVTFVPTSGACAAQQARAGFAVVCGRPVFVSSGGSLGSNARLFPNAYGTGGAPGQGRGDGEHMGEPGDDGEFLRRDLRRSEGGQATVQPK
ncbi:hypothetical protein HK414_03225 [Ramlibacter terrae]|uniref:Uncharacterized protein n=1 Tax=Ramlibacter terrae TaxID=2732511 RepID=A0ABX6P0E8_9BURK|nr:hypothetical protein HK414_03225 [Ramlibacter terrae]